ncbi:lactate utilization protein [bacterium]|nr:lactate utilization protein [bacterium]MBU1880886.1 lactate utilization protein [bacterium]
MSSEHAKQQIIARIRSAIGSISADSIGSDAVISGYHGATKDADELINCFGESLEQVGGQFHRCDNREQVADKIAGIVKDIGAGAAIVSDDIAEEKIGCIRVLNEAGCTILRQKSFSSELAEANVGITLAYAGIAETGTIIIPHRSNNGRLAALLPPVHIALLKKGTIYFNKPDLLAHLVDLNIDIKHTPMTWVTGPSLTADIEKVLVRGAHGPRRMIVILH